MFHIFLKTRKFFFEGKSYFIFIVEILVELRPCLFQAKRNKSMLN